MFFNKKDKETEKCDSCGTKISTGYNFCPYCGVSFIDPKKEKEDFGLLGKNDLPDMNAENAFSLQGLGITDKLISSLFNSLMKNLDKQFRDQMLNVDNDYERTEIRSFPNGIKIKISGPNDVRQRQKPKRAEVEQKVDEFQLKRMSELPREKAKAHVKRIGDKLIYELAAVGISSIEDIFVSKVETGYEIKAIGEKKVYVNNIPINLPLRKYSIIKDKVLFEFKASH